MQTEKESGTNSRNVKAMKFDRDFEIIIRCFARLHSRFLEIKRGRQLKARLFTGSLKEPKKRCKQKTFS